MQDQSTNSFVANHGIPGRPTVITAAMLDSIADLLADGLTETEACTLLGVNAATWRNWKCKGKNGGKFGDILTRVRASKIKGYLAVIRRAGEVKDWRAIAWLLERSIGDERFKDNKQANVAVNVKVFADGNSKVALRSAYGRDPTRLKPGPKPKRLGNGESHTIDVQSSSQPAE